MVQNHSQHLEPQPKKKPLRTGLLHTCDDPPPYAHKIKSIPASSDSPTRLKKERKKERKEGRKILREGFSQPEVAYLVTMHSLLFLEKERQIGRGWNQRQQNPKIMKD